MNIIYDFITRLTSNTHNAQVFEVLSRLSIESGFKDTIGYLQGLFEVCIIDSKIKYFNNQIIM